MLIYVYTPMGSIFSRVGEEPECSPSVLAMLEASWEVNKGYGCIPQAYDLDDVLSRPDALLELAQSVFGEDLLILAETPRAVPPAGQVY